MRWLVVVMPLVLSCAATPPQPPAARSTPCLALPASPPAQDAPPAGAPVAGDPAAAGDLDRARALLATKPPIQETAPAISADGKRIAFLSSEGGRALWIAEVGSSSPARKIPAVLPQRFRRPRFSPDGAHLYFTTDDHADEAFEIHRVVLATGAIEPVASGKKLRRDGPWFTARGDRLFFTAREMGERGLFLHERAAAGGEVRRVLAQPTQVLGAVRGDGGQVLTIDAAKANEAFVVDLADGKPRKIFPEGARSVSIFDATYSPDGKRALIATDDGGDHTHVVAIDLASGKVVARHRDAARGQVQELRAAGDRVAFILDSGVRHDLRLLDARTLKPVPMPALPIGSEVPGAQHPNSTGGLVLAADGKRAVLQWSTPASPARLHLVDTATGARSRVTAAPESSVAIETSIVEIASFDGTLVPTLIYRPAKTGPLPVVVSVHGGFPFAATARHDLQVSLLVAEGYAVVEPNVRGSGGFGRAFERADDGIRKLDGVRDLAAVARWIGAQPWADPGRLALTGRSAGGYYTLMGLSHEPDLWRAGIAIVPVYDVAATLRTTDGDLRAFWEQKEMVPLADSMMVAAISPSTWIGRVRAPLLVYAGVRDARATIGQNDDLVRTLRASGQKVEYLRSDEGHSMDDPGTRAELQARMLRFLAETLR